jgi:hypothetical protein
MLMLDRDIASWLLPRPLGAHQASSSCRMGAVQFFKLLIKEMSLMKLVKMLILFFAVVMLSITLLYAKAEYGKKEAKPCSHCHLKDNKTLNDVGKCYAKSHKLADCKTPEAK